MVDEKDPLPGPDGARQSQPSGVPQSQPSGVPQSQLSPSPQPLPSGVRQPQPSDSPSASPNNSPHASPGGSPNAAPSSKQGGATPKPHDPVPTLLSPEDAAFSGIEDVLRNEERGRAQVFFRAFQVIAIVTFAFMPILPGPFSLRAMTGIALIFGVATCSIALTLLARGAYTHRLVAIVGAACAIAGVSVVYYVGVFSAASMALTMGVYFFAASQNRPAARVVYIAVALPYLALNALIASNALNDTALFPTTHVPPLIRWFQSLMNQILLAVAFYLGRTSRKTLELTIERTILAGQKLRQRDAQLIEAHRELDKALRPGDGRRSGETLGPYKLGPLLGRGGMGEVYSAKHETNKEVCAIKVLHAHLLESEQHRKLFLREAEVSFALSNPHVAQTIALGETADGAPYLVMELLEGHDLGWILRKTGKLKLPAVVELVDQMKTALVAMRQMDIVHRDLKPGNLFQTSAPNATWKILDFGLSKALGTHSSMTQDQLLGTPVYMAPEQLRGQVSHVSDLYAVAAIVYRTLTGVVPFDGDDVARIVLQVAYDQPPSPTRYVRIPSDVELVLALGLAKSPDDRFATIEAFAEALRAAASGNLDDATRKRGWQTLRRAPWGSSQFRETDS